MSQQEITTSVAAYDVNFCFPVRVLENERVRLTPFNPDLHADLYFQGSVAHPELLDFFRHEPFRDVSDFIGQIVHRRMDSDNTALLFAVIDKTRSGDTNPSSNPTSANFAGIIAYINTSPVNFSTEIGIVIILPPFQRTHVTTNAVGLLLLHAFDLPPHGLGLRRVQWKATPQNTRSVNAAQRLGFKLEGIMRWFAAFPASKARASNGGREGEGDPLPGTIGSDLAMFAVCWDDWESERPQVLQAMDRRS